MASNLYQVIKEGKSGFINSNGEIIIDINLDSVSGFSEGLARIFIDDKVGYIDTNGDIVIEAKFDSASDFSEGLADASIGDKYGYIDRSGEFVINPQFNRCYSFENGYALVFKDVSSNGFFIDKLGSVKIDNRNFRVSKYREGLINCSFKDMWGYLDINNSFVIPPTYKYAREFSEGMAAVVPMKVNGMLNEKELFGFINKANEMIIPPLFNGSDIRFSEGMCAVYDNGYGYINDSGKLIIPCNYYLGQHFSEGLAVFRPSENGKYGYIDKSGKVKIKPIFSSAADFKNGIASVSIGNNFKDTKWGHINKNGEYIWEPTR